MRTGIVKKVYDSMTRQIIVGEFAPGEVLTDVFLADQFSSSRTPVREACIHLVKEGFLKAVPGRGYIVTEVSLDDVRDLYQLRLMIEPSAAELAAKVSLRKDFFITCSNLIEQLKFDNYDNERNYERFFGYGKAEYGFHCEIAKASGNKKLAKIMADIMNQYRRFHYVTFQRSPWLRSTSDEHVEILEAIRLQDASQASRLMHEHIVNGSQRAFQLVLDSLSGQSPNMAGATPNFLSPGQLSSGLSK
jgi:DNA-binding GntR family transcriptional regulator